MFAPFIFYERNIGRAFQQAALVTQVFDGPYVNLKVLPYGDAWDEGSVSEKADGATRYWEWPPKVEPAQATDEQRR